MPGVDWTPPRRKPWSLGGDGVDRECVGGVPPSPPAWCPVLTPPSLPQALGWGMAVALTASRRRAGRTRPGARLCPFIDEGSPSCPPAPSRGPQPQGGGCQGLLGAASTLLLAQAAAPSGDPAVLGPAMHPVPRRFCIAGPGRVLRAGGGAGPAATPGTPRSRCSRSPSHCPHRRLAREVGVLAGTGWRDAGTTPCASRQAGWVLAGSRRVQGGGPRACPQSHLRPLGRGGQGRPHTSRSWTQNSSRDERVSLPKVSQGWLPPRCRAPSSHSPNLPLRRCPGRGWLRVPCSVPRPPPGDQPPPAPAPGCHPLRTGKHREETGTRRGEPAGAAGQPPPVFLASDHQRVPGLSSAGQPGLGSWPQRPPGLGTPWAAKAAGAAPTCPRQPSAGPRPLSRRSCSCPST